MLKDSESQTAIRCLSLVANHHGIDANTDTLSHKYSLKSSEPDNNRLLRIATEIGLKAKFLTLGWSELYTLSGVYPVIAKLKNGNFVIIVDVRMDESFVVDRVAVFDPLATRGPKTDFLFLDKEKFESAWTGQILILKKKYSITDEKQPFSLKWFIPEIFRQRTTFLDIALVAVFLYIIALVVPLFFQIVIDKVLVNNAIQTLNVLGIGVIIALLFDAVLGFLRNYLLLHATSKIDIRIAIRTFSHLLKLPATFFDKISAGVLTKHMQQSSAIREFLTGNLFLTLLDSFALFIFLPVLFFYSVKLSFIVLGFAGLIALVIAILIIPFRKRLHALYQAEGDRQAMLVESIHGMSTVKALAMEPALIKKWENSAARAVTMQYRVGKISITAQAFCNFLEKVMIVSIVWFGAQSVFNSSMTVGALVAFQMVSGRVSGPLVQMVSLIHSYQEVALSVRMLGTVMNHPEEKGGLKGGLCPQHLQGAVSFEKVDFRYTPDASPALNDVSFHFPPGAVVGVVGKSGSGKTTLTRLIQGLYRPDAGIIRIDGYDLRELDLAYLRSSIGTVLQENFLFKGSVRDNIAMAKTNTTFDKVVEVAKMAGADEFIQKLPKSYDTLLDEGGNNLSGGQKQRLAIARALISNPRILILDEATSALDPESEYVVRQNLNQIARNRTLIIVSHRLSTLIGCDLILVINSGKIVSVGDHQKLLHSCKIYKDLWDIQTKGKL